VLQLGDSVFRRKFPQQPLKTAEPNSILSQTHTDLLCTVFSVRVKEVEGGTLGNM
jgi:hypothetical protein